MVGTIKVGKLQAADGTGNTISIESGHVIAGSLLQHQFHTPSSGQNLTDFNGQSSLVINNETTRGTSSISFSRKAANSFFIVNVGVTWYRPATTGLLKGGYRLNSGTDILTYIGDGNGVWVRSNAEFKDTTSGNAGATVNFETVFTNTAATNNAVRHISLSVMEIAQ